MPDDRDETGPSPARLPKAPKGPATPSAPTPKDSPSVRQLAERIRNHGARLAA